MKSDAHLEGPVAGKEDSSVPAFDLAVAIVNYRSPDLVIRCVRSILDLEIVSADRVVIVDNASGDGSAATIAGALPACRTITSSENRGYSAGLNMAMAAIDRPFVLCLNPDTYFEDRRVLTLASAFAENPRLAVVGLDLHYPSGERQFSARRDYSLLDVLVRRTPIGRLSFADAVNARHLMRDAWDQAFFDADWVIGTGFVVRKSAYDAIGGMDDGYFLYMEDVDLCTRLRKADWRVRATSTVALVHDHQRASAVGLFSRSARFHLASLRRFRRQHGLPFVHLR